MLYPKDFDGFPDVFAGREYKRFARDGLLHASAEALREECFEIK